MVLADACLNVRIGLLCTAAVYHDVMGNIRPAALARMKAEVLRSKKNSNAGRNLARRAMR